MQKEAESRCRLLRAAAEQTLVTQMEGAKGTDSRGHMWEVVSSCPLCSGQKESTGLTVFVGTSRYCWNFCMFPVLKTWTDKGGTTIRKRPVGTCHWIGSFPCLYTDTNEGNHVNAWHYRLWILKQTVKRETALLSLLQQDLQLILYPLLSLWLVCWGESCVDHKCHCTPSLWTRHLFRWPLGIFTCNFKCSEA